MDKEILRKGNFVGLTSLLVVHGLIVSVVITALVPKSYVSVLISIAFFISVLLLFSKNYWCQFAVYNIIAICIGLTGLMKLTVFNFIITVIAIAVGIVFEKILYKERVEKITLKGQGVIAIATVATIILIAILCIMLDSLEVLIVLLAEVIMFVVLQTAVEEQNRKLTINNCMFNSAIVYIIAVLPVLIIEVI